MTTLYFCFHCSSFSMHPENFTLTKSDINLLVKQLLSYDMNSCEGLNLALNLFINEECLLYLYNRKRI